MLNFRRVSLSRWVKLAAWFAVAVALGWGAALAAASELPAAMAPVLGGALGLWSALGFGWAVMPLLRDAGYNPRPRAEPTWRSVARMAFFGALYFSFTMEAVPALLFDFERWSWSRLGGHFGQMGLLLLAAGTVGLGLRKLYLFWRDG